MKRKARNLMVIRVNKGLTQRETGQRIGVSGSMIGYMETGQRNPSKITGTKLEELFNQSVSFLMEQVVL